MQQKFSELFNGLGLHVPSTAKQEGKSNGDPDMSYDIEVCTGTKYPPRTLELNWTQSYSHLKDIDPEWSHDEIDVGGFIFVYAHFNSRMSPGNRINIA